MTEPGRILIADDEGVYRESTADLLRARGYGCDCAPDGAVAARLLGAASYDLLVADLQMPGNENLDLLRSLSALADPPTVLIVTGYPSLDTAIETHRFDVIGYLVKPVNLEEFFACIERGVARAKRQRRLRISYLRIRDLSEDLGRMDEEFRLDADPAGDSPSYLEATLANILGSLEDLRRLAAATGVPGGAGGDRSPAPPADRSRGAELERAIRDAVAVLEKTKTAFKSKDLGELRQRLEAVLRQDDTFPG